VAEALAGSLNVPAVKMAEKVGASELLRFMRTLGISTLTEDADHYGLALTLGVGEIPLYELLRAYTVFSDAGNFCDFVTVPGVKSNCRKAADPSSALKIEGILTNRAFKLREFGALTALDFPEHFVFVKTGTSRNFRDNYAIGYTNRYLIAVWSGNKDGSNMKGVSGATGAGEIFSRIVTVLEPPGGAPAEEALQADARGYLEIVTPLDGSRYRVDDSIPFATQTVVPKFVTGIPFDRSEWTLDGNALAKEGIVIPNLPSGRHEIRITLWNGRQKITEKAVEFGVE
jgi:penicillin-binding protein 1C